jgi:hypothetical protein
VAEALLRARPAGPRRTSPGRPTPGVFPLRSLCGQGPGLRAAVAPGHAPCRACTWLTSPPRSSLAALCDGYQAERDTAAKRNAAATLEAGRAPRHASAERPPPGRVMTHRGDEQHPSRFSGT